MLPSLKCNLTTHDRSRSLRPGIKHNLHRIGCHRLLHRRLDFTQSKAMSDNFAQRVLPHVACHLAHTRSVCRRLFASHTEYADVLGAKMPMGTDGSFSHIRKVSCFD